MEKERKIKVTGLCALLVAVLGLTVAFAALSQTLMINGSTTVDTSSWNIYFKIPDKNIQNNGDGGLIGTPIINGTTISNLNFSISKPNDYIIYDFNIVNDGTINAKIDSVEITKLCTLNSSVESCDWDNDGTVTKTDVDKVNDNISFVIFENVPIDGEYGSSESNNPEFNLKGRFLNANKTKSYSVALTYSKLDFDKMEETESTELPKRVLQFKDLSVKINFVQA